MFFCPMSLQPIKPKRHAVSDSRGPKPAGAAVRENAGDGGRLFFLCAEEFMRGAALRVSQTAEN